MSIVFLGWPRTGSTWLHTNLMMNNPDRFKNLGGVKESHMFYSDPDRALTEFNHDTIDFSTNNWSMDSWIAKELVKKCDHFIMVHRPIKDIIKSYFLLIHNDINAWEGWQKSVMINKLVYIGDILQRWVEFTSGNISLYEFGDLQKDSIKYFNLVSSNMKLRSASRLTNHELSEIKIKQRPDSLKITNFELQCLVAEQEDKYEFFKKRTNYQRMP